MFRIVDYVVRDIFQLSALVVHEGTLRNDVL